MSNSPSNTKLRVHENDTEKHMPVKNEMGNDIVKAEVPRRVVLGNLQNRALPRNKTSQDARQMYLTDAKLPTIHEAKPHVSSHRKIAALPSVRVKASKAVTSTKSTGASLEVVSSSVAQRQMSEMKTVTTKIIENKLQHVKIVHNYHEESKHSHKSTKLKADDVKIVASKTQTRSRTRTAPLASQNANAVKSYSSMRIIDVRNIDENDKECLILVSEYVNDIYDYLFQLELEHPIKRHHLADQKAVTPKMRAILLDWIDEVHSQFHLVTETFYITVGIIDRYLQKTKETKRSQLQLVGATALFLASKYEELYAPTLADFVYVTDKTYNQQQFLQMELEIFKTLDWNLSYPVPIHFLRRFSKAANIANVQYIVAKYFLELAIMEYELASNKPSEIAAASLFLALHISKRDPKESSGFDDSLWNATLQHYSHYTAKNLHSITRKIAFITRQAPKTKLNAVYRKYQSSVLGKVSLNPELYSALMDSLIESDT